MKCGYCENVDHLETSCPTKAADRRRELLLAFVFVIPLGFFWILGAISGSIWSALKAGFQFGDGMWPQAWAALSGKKKGDGESVSG